MSVKIQVPELKGYKAIKNSALTPIIDKTVNSRWWDSDGWSEMYNSSYQEFYDLLKSGNFFSKRYHLSSQSNPGPAGFDRDVSEENQERLKQVFAFLEKKEKKFDPTRDRSNDPEISLLKKDNTIFVGNKGFSIIDKGTPRGDGEFGGLPYSYPYPCDGIISEWLGQEYSIVEDILDDGVFVLKSIDDMIEVYKSKDIPILQDLKNRMYLM